MRALADALEYALIACAWIRNEFVRDWVQQNRIVMMRLVEPYRDGDRCIRRRTVYLPCTIAHMTSLATGVIESRHA